jgi:LuxR family maltose regulon positive regulatory protein
MLRGWAQRYGTPVAPAQAMGGAGPLSAREVDVLARIAAGESNKLIARALDLSPHTVKRHVANILDKLDISSRGQAADWYRANRRMAR